MTFYDEDGSLTDEDNLFYLIQRNEGLTYDEMIKEFLTVETSGMKNKLKKILSKFVNAGYVKKIGRPSRYYLTYEGKEIYYNSIL